MTSSIADRKGSTELSSKNWTAVLTPPKGLFHVSWKELWEYRELIGLLVYRDFVSIYKQTFLGSLWHILQPLLQTLMFVLVFSALLKIPTNGIPPLLFFLSGIACWRYFADCALRTSTTFIDNQSVFDKIYFPRIVVPLALVLVNLVRFLIQILLLLCMYVFFILKGAAIHPTWALMALPLLIVELGALGLGVGCLISAFTTRY
ncbi:MAG: ABC transporter permease, partial [Verrucomicrobia bacterium]